jgi:hypothetical protein
MAEQARDAAFDGDGYPASAWDDPSKSPREFVETLASKKNQCFLGTIDKDGVYLNEMAKSLTAQTTNVATDYRDRFLVELIQNACDAQTAGVSDGRINVTLDLGAGKYGTLYIANTGQPFNRANVKSLSDIALSAKSVGQSIGNKGLGFRSVIQVTDAPQIFSQNIPCRARVSRRLVFLGSEGLDAILAHQAANMPVPDAQPQFLQFFGHPWSCETAGRCNAHCITAKLVCVSRCHSQSP